MLRGLVTYSRRVPVTFPFVRKRVVVRVKEHDRFLSCLAFGNDFRRVLVDASYFSFGFTVSFPRRSCSGIEGGRDVTKLSPFWSGTARK